MSPTTKPGSPEWGSFDSRSVPPELRTQHWARMTEKYLVPLEIRSPSHSVIGTISGRTSQGVGMCQLSATAHYGTRTPALASGLGTGHIKVAIALRTRVVVSQYGRRTSLRPGQMAVYDTSDEYSVGSGLPFNTFIALIPYDALDVRVDRVAAVSATALQGALSFRTRNLFLSAARDGSDLGPALRELSELIRSAPKAKIHRATTHIELWKRASLIVEEKISDRRLCPTYLASVLGVSLRRLYDAFDEGVGPIAAYIRHQRMDRARTLLSSPEWVDASIAQISLECGITDQAHFSRLFAHTFGESPRSYRAAETRSVTRDHAHLAATESTLSGT